MNSNKNNNYKKLIHFYYKYYRLCYFYCTNYQAKNPKAIIMELSNRCNLKCRMCWFHGENGIGDRYQGLELKTEEVLRFFEQFTKYKPKIYLGGAEPFIREDLLSILDYLKNKSFPVTLATNGTLLDMAKIQRIVDIGVDDIKFSIDGNEEVHDAIRGKGVFKKATDAAKNMAHYKKIMAKKKPRITINITINAAISGELRNILEAIRRATENSADFYRFHHLWYVSEKELTRHQAEVKRTLGCEAAEARAHLISGNLNPIKLADEIDQIRQCEKITFFPDLRHNEVIKFYTEEKVVKERCAAAFSGVVIKPNGEVKFCPDKWIDDYVIGNIRQERFEALWNNKQARKFRRQIIKQRHFAGCQRCSWMYSHSLF